MEALKTGHVPYDWMKAVKKYLNAYIYVMNYYMFKQTEK